VAIPPPPPPPTPPTRPLTEAELRAERARREAERRRVEREEEKRQQQRKQKEPLPPFELGIDFFDAEWKLLTKAWWMLSNHDKQDYLHQKVMEMRRQGRLPPTPDDPRFDQLIKLGPWQAYIEDPTRRLTGKDFVYKLINQPTPPAIRAIALIINALDDAEDILSFVALLGRIFLRAAPRVAVRFVPALNVIITAADVLTFFTAIMVAASVGQGYQAAGLTGAGVQATSTAAVKAIFKNELWEIIKLGRTRITKAVGLHAPLEKLARAGHLPVVPRGFAIPSPTAPILARRLPIGAGSIFEALQATETLWGVGLSLGAVVGYIQDIAWALYGQALGPVPLPAQEIARAVEEEVAMEWVLQTDWRVWVRQRLCYDPIGIGPRFGPLQVGAFNFWTSIPPTTGLDTSGGPT